MPHRSAPLDGLPGEVQRVTADWVCAVCGHEGDDAHYPLCVQCSDVVHGRRTMRVRPPWSRVNRVTVSDVTVKGEGG
jgi:hypothetical protein